MRLDVELWQSVIRLRLPWPQAAHTHMVDIRENPHHVLPILHTHQWNNTRLPAFHVTRIFFLPPASIFYSTITDSSCNLRYGLEEVILFTLTLVGNVGLSIPPYVMSMQTLSSCLLLKLLSCKTRHTKTPGFTCCSSRVNVRGDRGAYAISMACNKEGPLGIYFAFNSSAVSVFDVADAGIVTQGNTTQPLQTCNMFQLKFMPHLSCVLKRFYCTNVTTVPTHSRRTTVDAYQGIRETSLLTLFSYSRVFSHRIDPGVWVVFACPSRGHVL